MKLVYQTHCQSIILLAH